ncbi:prepilin-type N-terminal cleavage/methylation domain-containing protein [Virgibacillus sp. MSP4-1]|uniref:prepilin-type N-terminal cleavage/methylation domain-containing protein n=1 Tax=Virgibacillus sp. MSP4-1 TaxID=2700081 RepID=UPI0003A46BCC|nr:prepilin-type N-terminal cleavage/methylation domain-containing protein [Virgibacillus sp. MSP4-1]QHS24264.1 prepilin-type N-terminal cleavage/methylation domain-containing protein [Virgibacillus sp. MSP4-1]
MNSKKHKEQGMTLVELLAALAIISIILLLIGAVHLFGVSQYQTQSEEVRTQSDIRFAAKDITKVIRRANPDQVVVANNQIHIGQETTYRLDGQTLKKNNHKLATNIQELTVEQNGNEIELRLISVPNPHGNSVSISTVIYLRE